MKEIVQVFLRLGCLGFGGPLAVISMMEQETVAKRKWLTTEQFTRAFALIKIFPGPISTQLAIHIGNKRAGRLGGFLAGLIFILPAFFMVIALTLFYNYYSTVPAGQALFKGMQAAALAVILDSLVRLAKPYQTDIKAWIIGFISAVVVIARPTAEPVLIIGFGLLMVAIGSYKSRGPKSGISMLLPALAGFGMPLAGDASRMGQLFSVCAKGALLVFGSGLAIVPVLEGDVVQKFHWLTHNEFMDGLAIGQVTPGPVLITATFVGFKMAGLWGAIVATAGIFLPGFVLILYLFPYIEKHLEQAKWIKEFTSGAIPAVIGSIAGAMVRLGISTLSGMSLTLVFIGAMIAVFRFKLASWMVIPGAGLLYFLLFKIT